MADAANRSTPWPLIGALCLMGAGLGVLAGRQWAYSAMGDRAAMEQVVHDYILAHPEILPQAVEKLHQQEAGQQLAALRPALESPFPGAVIGNPAGRRVIVEFMDFACGYCRQSVADVDALVAAHPDVKVVVRQLPILTPASADAAKMALAAAEQGKYPAFHRAMFAAGRPDGQSIAAAARAAGLDWPRAQAYAATPGVAAEIARNQQMAQQLGMNGTPSWVVGGQLLGGALGREALENALAAM